MNLSKKGFTLVEVLAVLIILAAIMGLAIPSFTSSLEVNEQKQEKNRIERIETAAEIYVTNNKQTIYTNLGDNTSCYITTQTLADEGYITSDDNIDNSSVVKYTKPNTLEYLKTKDTTLSECI